MTLIARVVEERDDDVTIAALEGEVDASNAREIGEQLHALLTNLDRALVVDLAGATYLDSAGINLLFELASELDHRQLRLHLVVPDTSHVARIVAIAGLASIVPVHGTREAALRQAA